MTETLPAALTIAKNAYPLGAKVKCDCGTGFIYGVWRGLAQYDVRLTDGTLVMRVAEPELISLRPLDDPETPPELRNWLRHGNRPTI